MMRKCFYIIHLFKLLIVIMRSGLKMLRVPMTSIIQVCRFMELSVKDMQLLS